MSDLPPAMNAMLASDGTLNKLVYKHQDVHDHLLGYYGAEHLDRIQRAQTTTQSLTCVRVNTIKTTREQLINDLSQHFGSASSQAEYTLEPSDIVPFQSLPGPNDKHYNNDLQHKEQLDRIANEVILLQNRGPFKRDPKYKQVVVGATCGESVLRGSNIFAPGVIGSHKYISKGEKVSVFVDLDGNGKHGFIVDDCYRERTVYIGNGVSLMDRADYFNIPNGVAIEMTERIYLCPPLNALLPDRLYLQHLPSVLTVFQLDLPQVPEQNMRVLDMCAAPGGKTTLIATLMGNKGTVLALDKNKKKQIIIHQLCQQLGITNVQSRLMDSAKLIKEPRDPAFANESFDRVLLDGPCSGLGSRPRFIELNTLLDLKNAVDIQRRLIDNAVPLLKPGGVLVYSTCTINPEENECNVAYLLSRHPQMELLPQYPHLGSGGLSNCGLTSEQCSLVQRVDPSDSLSTIGFFIAKFKKRVV
ncbi:hypothetical protein SAMD00019534_103560 [Acytostelium subglobosum LB1]|uniref:hypothetical protein n=1 Tax=Acytostelium subglobosum LB1 TaxID=1410327 RepID=UPI0006451CD5|nr:hypothetical protein SAMD00019534_103560 [Acytostelium subglobosum LB1]GAM27181.1 hypothetical protein SAMD00019534_103560 [Acytostelium subglobosum LB1]|eukprot:XP_012750061.1 hypothetical protein SAMD00019534_103560 [Acytostelium subglobosum LB1]